MMEPTTVWMVHLARGAPTDGVKGTLSLDGDAVVFSSDAQDFRFDLASVHKVKRRKGSPVLQLDWRHQDSRRSTAFYFVQPPPLQPLDPGSRQIDPVARTPGLLSGGRMTRSRHRRTNIRYLQTRGINSTELIQAWADEIARNLEVNRR
jgi:hypothetical protein